MSFFPPVMASLEGLFLLLVVGLGGSSAGWSTAMALRWRRLRSDWAVFGALLGTVLWLTQRELSIGCWIATLVALRRGARWHREILLAGGDIAAGAAERVGVSRLARTCMNRLQSRRAEVRRVAARWLVVGETPHGDPATIPIGTPTSGAHALILGATGSGKTVSEAWIAGQLIEDGRGAVVIPEG